VSHHKAQMRQRAARKRLNSMFGVEGTDRLLREFREQRQAKQAATAARPQGVPPKPNPVQATVKSEVTLAMKRESAERMIQNPTPAEARMWELLKDSQAGAEYIRQVIIMGWIADFYCPAAKLVVEVDGGYHDERREADALRDKTMMRGAGIFTLRFTNEQVLESPAKVFDEIYEKTVIGLCNPKRRGWKRAR
jgi:very-short-patch-repair endonuclease